MSAPDRTARDNLDRALAWIRAASKADRRGLTLDGLQECFELTRSEAAIAFRRHLFGFRKSPDAGQMRDDSGTNAGQA